MNSDAPNPELWLAEEDHGCREQRAARLSWLLDVTPRAEIWIFPGDWLGQQLFEEARYCFVYGQFIASAMLGFAFVERTLAAMFYGAGRTEMERATGESLIKEARVAGWLTDEEFVSLNKARRLRNPLMHFRAPLHEELPEVRSFKENREPHEVVESDAKHILESMFRLLAQNAVG